ncbi:MAG: hypothetical protein ACJAV2_003516, partial [Myxococcota bacterium]
MRWRNSVSVEISWSVRRLSLNGTQTCVNDCLTVERFGAPSSDWQWPACRLRGTHFGGALWFGIVG